MTAFFIFLSVLLVQRFVELAIAKRHEKSLRMLGAVEVDEAGYRMIVLMHAAFLASIVIEFVFTKRPINPYWIILIAIFAAAQFLRYWAITSLGTYWNTKIIVIPDHQLVHEGPYKFVRHPNYIAVVTEIAVIPLIFSCYITAAVFTVLNAIVLRRRIRLETRALAVVSEGRE